MMKTTQPDNQTATRYKHSASGYTCLTYVYWCWRRSQLVFILTVDINGVLLHPSTAKHKRLTDASTDLQ